MVWTDTHAAAWALRERLKSSDITNYLQNLLRDQCARFVDGSTHTPVAEVQVLGTHGMRIETLRGTIRLTSDSDANPANLTVGNIGDPDVLIGSGNVVVDTSFSFSSAADVQVNVSLAGFHAETGWTEGYARSGRYGRTFAQSATGAAMELHIPIPRLMDGCTIKTFGALLDGDGGGFGHSGSGILPVHLPVLGLLKIDPSTRVETLVGSVTDPSANVAAYDALHWVDRVGNLAHAYDPQAEYVLRLSGETGANAVNGALCVYGMRLTYTATELRR